MNSYWRKNNLASPKPARIPPQTPPAGGNTAEAGRIHIPSQMFRPAESILILLEKGSRKVYNYSTNKSAKADFLMRGVSRITCLRERT